MLHRLPPQHLGVRVRERGAEVVWALEAVGILCLGVLQHVRRNIGANLGALDRTVEARCQRRVVHVVVGPGTAQPHLFEPEVKVEPVDAVELDAEEVADVGDAICAANDTNINRKRIQQYVG